MAKIIRAVQTFLNPPPEDIDILTTKGLLQDLLWRFQNVDIGALAAQLAYFLLLSFFPLMIFFIGLVPYLNLNTAHVYEMMAAVMPPDIFKMVQQVLNPILTNQNSNVLSLGALGTLWSASKGMNALMAALQKSYGIPDKLTLVDRFWSIVFTLLFLALIITALLLPIFGGQIIALLSQYIDISDQIHSVWNVLRVAMPAVMVFVLLLVIYWVIPKTKPRLRCVQVIYGTLFASLGWLTLTYGFSTYIKHFGNYSATYGSIGGVIILMLWLYLTGMILIAGGIINASLQRRYTHKMRLQAANR